MIVFADITQRDFHGLAASSIENDFLRVEFLTDAGPRLIGLYLKPSDENLFAYAFDAGWETPHGDYRLYGGHRLWIAPEVFPETSLPDNAPVAVETFSGGVELTQTRAQNGLTKTIRMQLAPAAPVLTVTHSITNHSASAHTLAPWGITILPLGGVAILPQPNVPQNEFPLGPNRQLTFWNCSLLNDARLEMRAEAVWVHARAGTPPFKVGCLNRNGRIGYWRDGILFEKHFDAQPERVHPDWNCNAEVYVNERYLELETLAPLTTLLPKQTTSFSEMWHLGSDVRDPDAALDLLFADESVMQ